MRKLVVVFIWVFSSLGLLEGQERSVFDLRQNDYNEPTELNNSWEFYWKELLDLPDESKEFVETSMPGDWHFPPNESYSNIGYGTYQTLILIDKSYGEDLGLYIPHMFSAYKLIINGELIYESGKVGRTKEEYSPYRLPKVFNLSALKSDTLSVSIQVANFDHINSGMHYPLVLGEYKELQSDLNFKQDVNLFLAGGLFITGFVLLAFGLVYRQLESQVPFYAIFSISLMYRMVGAEPYALHALFSNYPFTVAIHLEYLTIHTAALFGGLFIFKLYPKQTNRYMRLVFVCGTLISISGILIFPPSVFTGLLQYYLFFILFYVVVFIYIIAKARIEKEVTSGFLMFALILVLLWTAFQVVTFLDLGSVPFYVNIILMSLIIVFCNLALFRTLMLKAQTADNAQADLQLQKSKLKMLSLISHELKTPVATLRMNIEMLRASYSTDKGISNAILEKIVSGSTSAVIDIKSMVNDFVYFMSRADTGIREVTKHEIVDRLAGRFEIAQTKILLMNDKKATYNTDLLTLEYMVSTLVSNAVKYSSRGVKKPEILIYEDSDKLTVEVKDYGEGMSEEQVKALGNKKIELNEKEEVSGVGFYLAKELSVQLGHHLIIESQPDVGTSIKIEFENHD